MVQYTKIQIFQSFIVFFYNFFSSCQNRWVSSQLYKSKRCHNISHIAFIIRRNNVILPRSQLCLSQSIFRLTMQRKKHKLFVNFFIIYSVNISPDCCSAFCCCKILYCMKRKACKICNFSTMLSIFCSTKCMRTISYYRYSSHLFLYLCARTE